LLLTQIFYHISGGIKIYIAIPPLISGGIVNQTSSVTVTLLECVFKMPEAQLAGNSVAVTASLPAFLR
jgi:hypothetical protein